jgi:hypothetical protein
MSRASQSDNSTIVSLFPFLAVLLCTMGALLLILVVMVTVAREKAGEIAQAQQESPQDNGYSFDHERFARSLNLVSARNEVLHRRRNEAESRLRQEQLRLSHIEDHMRRLQDQLLSLQLAAAELDAMEQAHQDDHLTAQREVARLQKLIDETRKEIEQLRSAADGESSYAIIPYKGPNGTRRQPIYIECLRNEVILQPEGIRLTVKDFEPPLGAGNPLASALRTAREYMIRRNPEIGQSADTEPYPLIIVRPEGVMMYYRVRQAIECWDADFGYELVDAQMNLQFPPANPELANLEVRSIELARARQKMLAAAAPRAYAMSGAGSGTHAGGQGGFGDSDEFEGDLGDGFDGDLGLLGSPSAGLPGSTSASDLTPGDHAPPAPGGLQSSGSGSSAGGTESPSTGQPAGGSPTPSAIQGPKLATDRGSGAGHNASHQPTNSTPHNSWEHLGNLPAQPSQGADSGNRGTSGGTAGSAGGPTNPLATTGTSSVGTASDGLAQQGPSANFAVQSRPSETSSAGAGRDSFEPQRPGDVAVRRTIQVIVRRDRLSILPDREQSAQSGMVLTGGQEISLEGQTQFAVDEFVSALREHVRNWGIAGSGLYWKPVLNLNVGPDGQQRADEIMSLLENSGIDVQRAQAARRTDQTDAQTTRQ